MIVYLVIVLTIMFPIISAMLDSEHLNKGQYIYSHTSRWFLRMTFFCVIFVFNWKYGIASALMFTALFDQSLNYFTGNPPFYLGLVAKWDLFFRNRMILYYFTKAISLILSLLLFVI